MIFNKLHEEYTKMCNEQQCVDCKYDGDFSCLLAFGYSKGRADKYQEIVSEYMLLTEKQVAEIRADVIKEYHDKLIKEMHDLWILYKADTNNRPKPNFMCAYSMVDLIAEQLKEKKEC